MFGLYNMDVLISTSFSVETDSINNPKDPFVAKVKKLMNFSLFNPILLIASKYASSNAMWSVIGQTFYSENTVLESSATTSIYSPQEVWVVAFSYTGSN